MPEKNEASPDNSENEDDLKRPTDTNMSNVINELREVLAGLAKPKPPSTDEPDPWLDSPVHEPASSTEPSAPSVPAGPPPLKDPEPESPSEPTDSSIPADADFWNGNVLGWPTSPQDVVASPEDLESDRPTSEPSPAAEPETEAEEAEERFMADARFYTPPESPVIPPPPPPPRDELPPPAFENPPQVERSVSPAPPPTPPRPEPVAPRIDEGAFPIPGTLNDKMPVPAPEPAGNLEEPAIKPENLLQVACLFPEGEEKLAQQFVSKLKQATTRLKKDLQAVFLNKWTPDHVDPVAWASSAKLSGADVMFVLTAKNDAPLFKNMNREPVRNGVRQRLVYLEQIPLRNLYMDIVIELERGL